VQRDQPLKEYRWSSWPEYLKRPGKRWPWLRVDRVLGEWGVQEDTTAGRRRLAQAMEQRAALERSNEAEDWKALRRGWCWGPKGFRAALWRRVEGIRRAEGGAFGEGDADAGALDGSGPETPEQRRPEEGAHGGAIARGNDDDMGMDQQALADGALENSRQCRAERMRNEKY
jgi:hypothetical protein